MKSKPVNASTIYGWEYHVLPDDLNRQHTMFGGRAMALMDLMAAKVARAHSPGFWVTACVDHIAFLEPVFEDDVLLFFASMNHAWNTSCEIGVKILVKRPRTGIPEHVASAYLTFVAIDRRKKPRPIPQALPQTAEEKRRFQEAEERRTIRLAQRKRKSVSS